MEAVSCTAQHCRAKGGLQPPCWLAVGGSIRSSREARGLPTSQLLGFASLHALSLSQLLPWRCTPLCRCPSRWVAR